jgi:uncharacterized membrane protein (DUF4010 family)
VSSAGLEILLSLATAVACGLLIGAERQHDKASEYAGIRTFPLFALAGAVGMLLGTWVVVTLALAVSALVTIAYLRESRTQEGMGLSTEAAVLVAFGLGALTTARELEMPFADRLLVAGAATSVVVALLSLKKPLHGFIARVSTEDVYASVKLLVLAVLLLPLLPDRDLGPWSSINPRGVGLLVVLISGIGFAGYVAVRVAGVRRGLGITGLLGGLASSTAVTLSFSGRAKEQPDLAPACAVAIVLASATMFPRMIVDVWAVAPGLVPAVAGPLCAAGVVALAVAGLSYWRARRAAESGRSLQFTNPFSLGSALKFTLLFVAVLVGSKALQHFFQDAGVYASAVVAGFVEVDAITLSLGKLHAGGSLERWTAVDAIGIAAVSNTLVKAGLATVLGGVRLGVRVGLALAAALVAGFVVRILL